MDLIDDTPVNIHLQTTLLGGTGRKQMQYIMPYQRTPLES